MTAPFTTLDVDNAPVVAAPDGSSVSILPALAGGSMARFRLEPGAIARAVTHRSVEEIWYVTAGTGRMWRRQDDAEAITGLAPGTAITIPSGCNFQFRCDGDEPLDAIAVTMPPWPGEDEAIPVEGPWIPTFD